MLPYFFISISHIMESTLFILVSYSYLLPLNYTHFYFAYSLYSMSIYFGFFNRFIIFGSLLPVLIFFGHFSIPIYMDSHPLFDHHLNFVSDTQYLSSFYHCIPIHCYFYEHFVSIFSWVFLYAHKNSSFLFQIIFLHSFSILCCFPELN